MAKINTHTEDDTKLIQRAYFRLLRSVQNKLKGDDKENIRKAYEMAVQAHRSQRRKSGEPYILHPIEVALICSDEIGLGPTAIICALLHDVVEDTEVTLEDINKEFGGKIAMIVDGLTKFDEIEAQSKQAENFKKVLSTLLKDVRVVLIKMADRLHNMRTLGAMPPHKQIKIASETNYIYSPLAHRLGLYNIRTEFQDLCMKILEPENYKWVAQKLQETKKNRNAYIDKFIEPLKEKLEEAGIPNTIYGRSKSISSIWNKVENKNVSFEEIYDLFAIRIILDVPLDEEKFRCWEVYTIVTETNQPIPSRLKDWITTPKSNGYESLHTTVIGPEGRFVEVQIRSARMHDIAEKGFAAHWKYKGVKEGSLDVFSVWLDNIRDVLENPNEEDAVELIRNFKTSLFHDETYVFTPNGDMKILPKGATALDFAFDVHTEVGYHCRSVKVNNNLVPLGYVLKNGDRVSVETSKNQKPTENWLNYVVTGKARSKIRSSMKEERRKQGELGREALLRKFKNIKADFETNIDMLVKHLGYNSRPDLFLAIVENEVAIQKELRNFKVEGGKLIFKKVETPVQRSPQVDRHTLQANAIKNLSKKASLMIDDRPASQFQHSLATCCNPVMGDPVFAYVTSQGETKIHRNTCPNAEHMMANYSYRMLKADWVQAGNTAFVAKILMTGIDGKGMVQKITDIISNQLGIDIRSISMDGNQGFFKGRVSILVKDKEQLEMIMNKLEKEIEGIRSIVREKD